MSKTVINFWLDLTLLVLFLSALWSAVVVRFVFPNGTSAAGWSLWGANYDDWTQIQFTFMCMLAFCVLIHIMLHWSWVCGVVSNRMLRRSDARKRPWTDGERTLIGVGLMVAVFHLLAIGFAAARLMVQPP